MDKPIKRVGLARKMIFYGGAVATIFGVLSFFHAIIVYVARLVNFVPLVRAEPTETSQLIGSMVLMLLGGFLLQIGARGSTTLRPTREPDRKDAVK